MKDERAACEGLKKPPNAHFGGCGLRHGKGLPERKGSFPSFQGLPPAVASL